MALQNTDKLSQEDKTRVLELFMELGKHQKELELCKSMVQIQTIYKTKLMPTIDELVSLELKSEGKTNE